MTSRGVTEEGRGIKRVCEDGMKQRQEDSRYPKNKSGKRKKGSRAE